MASKIREKIIDHAIRCFAVRGFAGCSTKEISQKADVSEHSLFRLFGSKEKLFAEALASALSSKVVRRKHLRVAAFALLERQGLTPAHLAALRKLSKDSVLVKELLAVAP